MLIQVTEQSEQPQCQTFPPILTKNKANLIPVITKRHSFATITFIKDVHLTLIPVIQAVTLTTVTIMETTEGQAHNISE